MIKTVFLLIAFAFVPWQDVHRGPITLRFDGDYLLVIATVEPYAINMRLDRPDPVDLNKRVRDERLVGFPGYERIAVLVKPVRRWAGGRVPCKTEASSGGFGGKPVAYVRWEADKTEVEVPITCISGPAQDEIELVRAAIDEIRRWEEEPAAKPFGGVDNRAYYNAIRGEPE